MSRTNYYIQTGLIVKKSDSDKTGLFSLNGWLKKMLDRFHVPYVDSCCTSDLTNLPIRYNQTASKLQYFNATTGVWTNLTTF